MPQPHLRAADTDRAAVADVLGRHMSAGRLTLDEFDERLTRAYAAKTYGELDALTADLPAVHGDQATDAARTAAHAPARTPARVSARAHEPMNGCGAGAWGHGSDDLAAAWRSWLITALIVIGVWATISLADWELLYFWPVWVIGPWGAVLLARTVAGRREEQSHGRGELRS